MNKRRSPSKTNDHNESEKNCPASDFKMNTAQSHKNYGQCLQT